MKCIMAGCVLINAEGRWLSCELFQTESGTYVANGPAMLGRNTDSHDWRGDEPFYLRTITLETYWERCGVFVFEPRHATFNQAAIDYLDGGNA